MFVIRCDYPSLVLLFCLPFLWLLGVAGCFLFPVYPHNPLVCIFSLPSPRPVSKSRWGISTPLSSLTLSVLLAAFSSVRSFCTFKIHLLRSWAWCCGYPPLGCAAFTWQGPWFLLSRAVSSIRFSLHSGCWKKQQMLDEKYGAHA